MYAADGYEFKRFSITFDLWILKMSLVLPRIRGIEEDVSSRDAMSNMHAFWSIVDNPFANILRSSGIYRLVGV